jgi:hypothetical protein
MDPSRVKTCYERGGSELNQFWSDGTKLKHKKDKNEATERPAEFGKSEASEDKVRVPLPTGQLKKRSVFGAGRYIIKRSINNARKPIILGGTVQQ